MKQKSRAREKTFLDRKVKPGTPSFITFPDNPPHSKFRTGVRHATATALALILATNAPNAIEKGLAAIDANAKRSAEIHLKANLKEKQLSDMRRKPEIENQKRMTANEFLRKRMNVITKWTQSKGLASTPLTEHMLDIILRAKLEALTRDGSKEERNNFSYEHAVVEGTGTLRYTFGLMDGPSIKLDKTRARIREIWLNSVEGETPELIALLKKRVGNKKDPLATAEIIRATANTPIEIRRAFYEKFLKKLD